MQCSCMTENNLQSDKKEILINNQDKKYNSVKHFKRQQLSFMKTRTESEVSRYFSTWTRGKNIAQSFLFTTNSVTKYSSDRFLSSRG